MRVLLVLAAMALASPAVAKTEYLQTDTKSYPVTPGHRVEIEFPVGHLQVEANDDTKVRLTISVKCRERDTDDCEAWARKLRLTADDNGKVLSIKLDKYPKWHSGKNSVEAVLQVPRKLALQIEMGVGELVIDGMGGELGVELGVGEANVRMPKSQIADVVVEVGVGDASIRGTGSNMNSRGWLGRTVRFSDGAGAARVHLEVGVGEGTVHLD